VFALNILFVNENTSDELYELVKNGSDSQLDARLHELGMIKSNSIYWWLQLWTDTIMLFVYF